MADGPGPPSPDPPPLMKIPGSALVLMHKFVLLVGVSNSFMRLRAQRRNDFVPEEVDFSLISNYILH